MKINDPREQWLKAQWLKQQIELLKIGKNFHYQVQITLTIKKAAT